MADEKDLKDLKKNAKTLERADVPGFEPFGEPRTYELEHDWDVVVHYEKVDDVAGGMLNGPTVIRCEFGEIKTVSLKNLLNTGSNTFEVQAHNVHPPVWSLRYVIGIFDADGNPKYAGIDITVRGKTPHLGMQHQDFFYFVKKPKP